MNIPLKYVFVFSDSVFNRFCLFISLSIISYKHCWSDINPSLLSMSSISSYKLGDIYKVFFVFVYIELPTPIRDS